MSKRPAHPEADVPRLVQRDGVYNVVWTEPAIRDAAGQIVAGARTKRLGLRTRDPETAKARFAAFLTEGQAFAAGAGGPDRLSVAAALDQYYREHVSEHDSDPARAEYAIRHLKSFFGDRPFPDVDIPACREYAKARRAGSIGGGARVSGDRKRGGNSTVRRELVVLRAAANHAARWKRLGTAAVPPTAMPTFELPDETATGDEVLFLDRAAVHTILLSASGPLHHFCKLVYWWGARRGWVERLHVDQVNFETGRVNPYKKGERVTNKRRVMAPVFPQIAGNLAWLVERARAGNGYLFGAESADFYRPFNRLCTELGYADRANPHVLRHSRATHMLMAGESIYKVARLLGDSVQTVERVYGHHSVEYLMEKKR